MSGRSEGCHRQLTVKAGGPMEKVTVQAVLTVLINLTSNNIEMSP